MPAKSFEDRLARLEQIAATLREGQIPLEEAISLFEEGSRLSKALEKDLARVERKIQILSEEQEPDAESPKLELFPDLPEGEEGQSP